jgi:hypothetical protein
MHKVEYIRTKIRKKTNKRGPTMPNIISLKAPIKGWECSSVVEHLASMYLAPQANKQKPDKSLD